MEARLITLNVAGLGLGWLEGRFEAAVSGLLRPRPDIVCFQEVALRHVDTLYDQTAELGRALGLRYQAFAPYGNPPESTCCEEGGISLVSRWPLMNCRSRRLAPGLDSQRDSRVALLTTLETPAGELHVVNTHFSWRPEEEEIRLVQMRLLFHEIESSGWVAPGAHTILCGDLNGDEEEPAIRLACSRLTDAFRACHPGEAGPTWSEENPYTRKWPMPNRRLDYVLCTKSIAVRACERVLTEPTPVFASDHFGVLVVAEIA